MKWILHSFPLKLCGLIIQGSELKPQSEDMKKVAEQNKGHISGEHPPLKAVACTLSWDSHQDLILCRFVTQLQGKEYVIRNSLARRHAYGFRICVHKDSIRMHQGSSFHSYICIQSQLLAGQLSCLKLLTSFVLHTLISTCNVELHGVWLSHPPPPSYQSLW